MKLKSFSLIKSNSFIFIECARNYTQPQGRLFGKTLSDCESYISVPENYTISLYFASLDFRLSGQCTENNTPLRVSRLQFDDIE